MSIIEAVRDLLQNVVISTAETDRNGEAANLVDALFAVARAIEKLAAQKVKR